MADDEGFAGRFEIVEARRGILSPSTSEESDPWGRGLQNTVNANGGIPNDQSLWHSERITFTRHRLLDHYLLRPYSIKSC